MVINTCQNHHKNKSYDHSKDLLLCCCNHTCHSFILCCTVHHKIPMILSISAYMMILKLRLLRCRFCPVFLLRMLTDHSFLYLYLLFLTAESSVTVNKRILPAFRFRYRQIVFSDTGRYFEIVFVIIMLHTA